MSQAACAEFGCDGCVNRDAGAGIQMGCAWCPKPSSSTGGDCVPMSMAATLCAGTTLRSDAAVCSMSSSSKTSDECANAALNVCRSQCPKQLFLFCRCPNNPMTPEFECAESGLNGGIIAGIAVGVLVFVVLVVGLVWYLARGGTPDVVVVDRSGKKVKMRNPKKVVGADGSTVLSNRAVAKQSGNPGPDGLWYCAVDGDPTCNRAYMSQEELTIHIQKRHPGVVPPSSRAPVSVANPTFNAAAQPMLQQSMSFSQLQTANSLSGFNPGAISTVNSGAILVPGAPIFKCQYPGCQKAYNFESDLVTHIQFRHAGNNASNAPIDGASMAFRDGAPF